jgi:hypothetical protein
VVDVLSRFPFVHADPRFQEMVKTITSQADGACLEPVLSRASPEPRRRIEGQSRRDGRYTAGSMYRAWKGWSFADKKSPSPWLTFLVLRVQKRIGQMA